MVEEVLNFKDKPDLIIFPFFHIDPEASKDIDNIDIPNCRIIKAQNES